MLVTVGLTNPWEVQSPTPVLHFVIEGCHSDPLWAISDYFPLWAMSDYFPLWEVLEPLLHFVFGGLTDGPGSERCFLAFDHLNQVAWPGEYLTCYLLHWNNNCLSMAGQLEVTFGSNLLEAILGH